MMYASAKQLYTATFIPKVFCWTKMGSEAGQTLDEILRRKELERLAGGGAFGWGIGNSLGLAVNEALHSHPHGVPVLFSPMKSSPKKLDQSPDEICLWTAYQNEYGDYVDLPEHIIITSRRHTPSGAVKKNHYALLCFSEDSVEDNHEYGSIDSSCVVNYLSKNSLGASQVTAMVNFESINNAQPKTKPYPIKFRALLFNPGFVKLAAPAPLTGHLKSMYEALIKSTSVNQWKSRAHQLKSYIKNPI